ncbi:malate synthase A [Sphaerobacter thermophilus]|uniref:Malate synthase n=1 Tax=Sphaerobacter thermophilus (strain ATCC 49802 / DSM 20745 / KCCM 41009 / NCIMB 13125 / S 6022) TaxID=479434 RepID=D1C921_SPHTD|nr:malate synthase A [Sphaerobacter thermophilus DSM 20745]
MMANGIRVVGPMTSEYAEILTPEALAFVERLHREFNPRREELLRLRQERQAKILAGGTLDFLPETRDVREGEWSVAPAPADLNDRRVEITGPVDRKMIINALNSGAKVFMADFEDANSPTWANIVEGQRNLRDAVRRTISFENPDGRRYELRDETATLVVRPRGWHLVERHVEVDGQPVSASLFDFGLYFFHNAAELIARGSGPYFYLPKLQGHLEARLWNDVFRSAQDALVIPQGTIRATVLVETIWAAFEMDEILYELREHASGLNAGRWDYIFSVIKTFRDRPDAILPDRAQVTMTVPFMRTYTELLVRTCHRRGAHAIGGMAAFIPSRRDPKVNEVALAKVREDKEREAGDGFDGTWVAHPDLVPVAQAEFDRVLGDRPHQKDRLREDVQVTAADLLAFQVPGGTITEEGIRNNVSVALQYINSWLQGVGAAAIFNLMEDAATAEISRAQLWQWLHHGARTAGGGQFTAERYERIRDEELAKLGGRDTQRYADAAEILDSLVLSESFTDFLTVPAYALLE